jgi:hypothetical protein
VSKVARALLSVSDKSGIVELARSLAALGIHILSTGGTAKLLEKEGIAVTEVSAHTGFPEMLDGRVKTLHPKIHGGLLARRDDPAHLAAIKSAGIAPIDLLVVNLYPFQATVADPDCRFEDAVEHRHRRPWHAARRGEEPRRRRGGGRPCRLPENNRRIEGPRRRFGRNPVRAGEKSIRAHRGLRWRDRELSLCSR